MVWVDVIGWIGVGCVVVAYAMVALQFWHVRSVSNQLVNFIGAGALGFNSFVYEAWVPAVLNLLWAMIAVYILIRLLQLLKFQDE